MKCSFLMNLHWQLQRFQNKFPLIVSIFISSEIFALRMAWQEILDSVGNHLAGPSSLRLLHLLLVELHRLPRTRRRRPLWRLQNRLGDGELSWRRLWRLFPEQFVHETRFSMFDHALLWWHWGCWRSKGGTRRKYQFIPFGPYIKIYDELHCTENTVY